MKIVINANTSALKSDYWCHKLKLVQHCRELHDFIHKGLFNLSCQIVGIYIQLLVMKKKDNSWWMIKLQT